MRAGWAFPPAAAGPRKQQGFKLNRLISVTDHTDDLAKALKELGRYSVLVGIPAETAGRDEGPMNSAAIGYVLETGAPERNLPARPFLVPGVASASEKLNAIAAATLRQATRLDTPHASLRETVQKGLASMGQVAANAVKARINSGDFAPLAPSTIYRRQHRKHAPRSGEKPLIDTAQMRNAVTYVVRRG